MSRKICYITGTRADFGLMRSSLELINKQVDLDLEVIVTGQHLLPEYGKTVNEIHDAGLTIISEIEVSLSGESGAQMSTALAEQLSGITQALKKSRPDIVILLGDRGEMLAAAIAALHLNIIIVHIHGGELSGTIDESIRHAISKLSHYHFTSTSRSKDRLIKMGEKSDHIFVTGAPGLDQIRNLELIPKDLLLGQFEMDSKKPFILLLFHPVVQEMRTLEEQFVIVLEALITFGQQIIALMPNADAGGQLLSNILKRYEDDKKIKSFVHLNRVAYLSLLSEASALVGNSSSGIIEAASLGIPVVNIGTRQNLREQSNNVINVSAGRDEILGGLDKALAWDKSEFRNVYGDGDSSQRIVRLLKELDFSKHILDKVNGY